MRIPQLALLCTDEVCHTEAWRHFAVRFSAIPSTVTFLVFRMGLDMPRWWYRWYSSNGCSTGVRWNASSMVWRFFWFRLGSVLRLHSVCSTFSSSIFHRSARECPCLDFSLEHLCIDPGYISLCNLFFPFDALYSLISAVVSCFLFLSRPGVSVSFEELTEAERPWRSWDQQLIWLNSHYRIYRGVTILVYWCL